jgi:serine/threonine-protein kinase RsbW/sigma-B regulation protein RsbU (phosphoserine phosphatase)
MTAPATLEFVVRNDQKEVQRVVAAVEQFLTDQGAGSSVVYKVTLCLDELLTNIISYGFVDSDEHVIDLRLAVADGEIDIELVDDARPFNPLDMPPPDLDAGVEEREVGGLGIHFVRESMDRVAYRRHDDRNRLTMRRALTDVDEGGG